MVRESQEYCPGCGNWWEEVCDFSFQPKPRQPSTTRTQEWDWPEWTSSTSQSRRRSSSASRRMKGKDKNKDKGKGQGKDKGRSKNKEKGKDPQEAATSPFSLTTPGGSTSSLPSPFPTMATVPALPQPQEPIGPGAELAAAIRKAFPDSNNIPMEIREALDKSDSLIGKQVTQELHRATASLGRAQKSVRELEDGREKHRLQWMTHMKESLHTWEKQLMDYDARQQQYGEAILKAKLDTDSAHRQIQILNAKAAGKPPPEYPAPAEEAEYGPPQTEEDVEERSLRKQLHNQIAKCALHLGMADKVGPTTPEVFDLTGGDGPDKDGQTKPKRLRSSSPPKQDASPPKQDAAMPALPAQ